MCWFQPEHLEPHRSKLRRCSVPGPRPRAQVRDVWNDDVTHEEARAPRACAYLQLCRLAHVLHAKLVELTQVAHEFGLLYSHNAKTVGLHHMRQCSHSDRSHRAGAEVSCVESTDVVAIMDTAAYVAGAFGVRTA